MLTTRRLVVLLLVAGVLRQPKAATGADGREDLVGRVLEELVGAANMFGDAPSGAVAGSFARDRCDGGRRGAGVGGVPGLRLAHRAR